MRLGFVTAHSDTPTLPRCPWRSQKYTVPVCAHCVPDSRHRHAQQRGRVPIPMSIGASELGRRKGPAPDLDRVCECEADRQGQAPTHVKLQPCSPVLHHHVAPCPLARLARHMEGATSETALASQFCVRKRCGGPRSARHRFAPASWRPRPSKKPALGQTCWGCSRLFSSLDRAGPRIQACFDTSGSVSKARMAWINLPGANKVRLLAVPKP